MGTVTLQEMIDFRVEMGISPEKAERDAQAFLEKRSPMMEHPLVKAAQAAFGGHPALLKHRPTKGGRRT